MTDGESEIAYCHDCGAAMDVSKVAPFSNVECPSCRKHTRVKREFGPYTLTKRYAIGGMSQVFVGRDNTLDREVVLKILNEDFSSDEKRIVAFEEEARITAAIGHPHVVRVFTTGRAFGRFFIAMEFVPGGHFEGHIRDRGSIPEAEALPLMIQVAEGLKAAHQAGLIHRDIKPGNILMDGHGKAKIVDFGLALITQGGTAQADEIWATPYYVPPETIEGLPEDFRSDVYAFGSTFYHALVGKPPCDEESMDTNRLRKAKQNIPPIATTATWLTAGTCGVIDRCMAHDANRRFSSYEELISALKSARQQLAAGPRATPGVGSGRTRGGSGIGEKAALGFAALLILVAAGFGWRWIQEGNEEVVAVSVDKAEVVVSRNPVPRTDGGAGIRVATKYRQAGEALRRGDYSRAREFFLEVRDDPDVLEPTGSWAACEVVMAGFLDGRSGRARRDSWDALGHVRSAEGLPEGNFEILENVLGDISRIQVIVPPENFDNGAGPRFLSWMLSGLKNWEQGCTKQAVPFFEAVASAPTDGNHAWLAPYAKLAKDYLFDARRLAEGEPKNFVMDQADYAPLIDELHGLHASLRSKGRGKFNVRVWQLELEKQVRMTPKAEPKVVVQEGSSELPSEVDKALEECRFDAAVIDLKSWKPDNDEDRDRQLAMLTLAEAATAFLVELGERSAGRSGPEVVCRDGRKFEGIAGGDAWKVSLKAADGGEVSISWKEVEPDSLIEWHRELSRGEGGEIDKLRRHEQAIAFDLLAGDAGRGEEAAARLAESSEAFGRRWKELQPALQP